MDRIFIGNQLIEYVPRTLWTETDKGFKQVSLENRIANALERHRFALLMGISGIGKSTTTEYIAKKMAEKGWIVVKIIPKDSIKDFKLKITTYRRDDYIEAWIVNIYLSNYFIGSTERLLKLALAISKIAKKPPVKCSFIDRVKKLFSFIKKSESKVVEIRKKEGIGVRDVKAVLSTAECEIKLFELDKKDLDEIGSVTVDIAKDFDGFECIKDALNSTDVVKVIEVTNDLFKELGLFTAKEVLKTLKESLPIVSMILGLALFLLNVIEIKDLLGKRGVVEELYGRLRKGIESLEKDCRRLLLIVDDLIHAEVNGGIKSALMNFLELCYKAGCCVFIVRRLSLEEEFGDILEILNASRNDRIWLGVKILANIRTREKFWGCLGYDELKDCVIYMLNITREEFKAIIRANWSYIAEKRKELNEEKGLNLKFDFEEIERDIDEWYYKTAGIPYLALALMCYKDINDLKLEDIGEEYFTKPFLELDEHEAKRLLNVIVKGYIKLYEEIHEKEFYRIPVILQPITEDEALKFYEKFGENPQRLARNLKASAKRDRGTIIKRDVQMENDKVVTIEIYDLSESNLKLRDIFSALASFDEIIRNDLIKYRRELLRILFEKSKKTGGASDRMIWFAREHLKFLENQGIKNDEIFKLHLFWQMLTLQLWPNLGMKEALKMIKIAEKQRDIFALNYLYDLAQKCRFYEFNVVRDILPKLWYILNYIDVKKESLKAKRIMAKSKLLLAIYDHRYNIVRSEHNIKNLADASRILEEYNKLESEAKELRTLKDYVLARVLSDKSEVLMWEGMLKEAKNNITECLKACDKLSKDAKIDEKEFREFLSPFENTKRKFRDNINFLRASAHFKLGIVLMDLKDFERAKEEFKISAEINNKLYDYVEEIKCKRYIRRIEIFENYEFGNILDFSDLFKESKRYRFMFDVETMSTTCAEYLLSILKM